MVRYIRALASEDEDVLVFTDSSIEKAHRAAAGSTKGNSQRVLDAHAAAGQVKFTPLYMYSVARCALRSVVDSSMTAK